MSTEPHAIQTDVLVVGGGPVGMLVAAELASQQVDVVVVESRTDLDLRPRAGTVHTRTLSLLARRGYIPSVPADAIARNPVGVHRSPFQFAAQPVLTLSAPSVEPAPIAGIPQARLEAAFEDRARSLGARILRGHSVVRVEVGACEVTAWARAQHSGRAEYEGGSAARRDTAEVGKESDRPDAATEEFAGDDSHRAPGASHRATNDHHRTTGDSHGATGEIDGGDVGAETGSRFGLRIRAKYVVGADGARSLVARTGNFPAQVYPATMNAIAGLAVSDAPAQIPPGWNPTPTGWTMHNPNPGGQARIIAMDFSGPLEHRPEPTEAEYRERLAYVLGAEPALSRVSHLTRFSDHGRYRTSMWDGRLLLAGDAAHSHYPLGGQGLNSGIQDAFALGWRLARVVTGRARPTVLADYSRERVAHAAAIVGNTVLQSRMMNPANPQVRDAVLAMLAVPAVHDGIAELISGQFQPGFQHDLVLTENDGRVSTLAELLHAGRFVAIRPDEHTPVPEAPDDALVITAKVIPDQTWTSAVIRPDGYLASAL
ncbi:FAD-dependent monooxygenase [Nocardia caishijiensis]|uniref:FAD binding domain-containing protein n=1 Tax=Nocardia caishijiensis TaxID=184756 RepID=A0ABQ6YTC1_9NOCA|nr:FAD-dependent monooxygenase [Nocardia caishijiensis]KAF0849057.1 FAD binding domain-containing protein [Nocardia caishijiensis]